MYSAHRFPRPIVWTEKNNLSKRVSYFRKSADFNVFCHFPLLIHFKVPHREGMLFGLEEYWRLGALSSVTDLVKLDRKVCRICPLLILIPLKSDSENHKTVSLTSPMAARDHSALGFVKCERAPGRPNRTRRFPCLPAPLPRSVLLSPVLHPGTRKAGCKKWTHILSFFSSSLLL